MSGASVFMARAAPGAVTKVDASPQRVSDSPRSPAPAAEATAPHGLARLQHLHGNRTVWRMVDALQAHPAGSGSPLDPATRQVMESRIGRDLGAARLHTDGRADAAARMLGAAAFSIGSDLYFRTGRFTPRTPAGERLLSHELAHAAQAQSQSGPPARLIGQETDTAEAQARQVADSGRMTGPLVWPAALISLAPETWYRGDAVGAASPKPGAFDHDLGDGLYLADDRSVANQYADTRVSENARLYPNAPTTTPRTRAVTIERSALGKVLDLTTDKRWKDFLSEPYAGHTRESLMRIPKEGQYKTFFDEFVSRHKIDLKQYDAVIGPEFVRGGKQICIRSASKIQEIEKALTAVPKVPPTGGRGGSGSSGSGGGAAEKPKAPANAPKSPSGGSTAQSGARPAGPAKPVAPPEPAAPIKPPTKQTAPAPKPGRKELSFRRPSYGSGVARVGVNLGVSVGSGLLLGWMWESMKKSARETPAPKREIKEAGGFLKAIRDKDNLKTIDLVSTTIHDYSHGGFATERGELVLQYFQAYGEIDSQPDVTDRRVGIARLQRETVANISELETMLDNIDKALTLEKNFKENIEAADDLHTAVLHSSYWLFTYLGLSVEDISQILDNLKNYSASHRLTLDGLKKLKTDVAEARTADLRLLQKLNDAWNRGSLAERKQPVPASTAPQGGPQ